MAIRACSPPVHAPLARLFLSIALLLSCGFAASQTFTVTDLGKSSDTSSTAWAINSTGTAAGSFGLTGTSGALQRAFTWSSNVRTDDFVSGYPNLQSQALAVNAEGCAVGWGQTSALAPIYLEVWATGSCAYNGIFMTSLGGSSTQGRAVNASGQIAGTSQIAGDNTAPFHGFLMKLGVVGMTDLAPLAGGTRSAAFGLNDSGLVVGSSASASSAQRAVKWESPAATDLGTLPGGTTSTESVATAVNAGGVIVGWSIDPSTSQTHAVKWTAGAIADLGVIAGGGWSEAHAVNTAGDVVGWSRGADFFPHAVLWRGTTLIDLNSRIPAGSLWTLNKAYGINDSGQIVGVGRFGGMDRAFLLTPVPPPAGDTNGDGVYDPADVFYLIQNLFAGGPGPVASGDVNGDGFVTVVDVFYLINNLFAGGPAPM